MPTPVQEVIRRLVIEQWLSGEARDKIASDLQIGAGTVSGIVSDFKKNLQASDIDSVRELAIDAKRQVLSLSDLASHFRLYNYLKR
jgi:transposase